VVQYVAMGAKRYESLDGMRGLCALIVTAYHCAYALNTAHFPDSGWLSVDMFFVLSGFVIALAYEDRLKAGFSFSDFLRGAG
jgi:peptidoglycan/LPS O-acetylase OafA/YrhL